MCPTIYSRIFPQGYNVSLTAPQVNEARRNRLVVYVASRASIPQRAAMWRNYRDEHDARIISSWIDQDRPGETSDFRELWEDIHTEIRACQRLVLYADHDDFPLKGALVEVGIALGMGKPVWVLGGSIKLEGRTDRPFGSWIRHPAVERIVLGVTMTQMLEALGCVNNQR